MLGQELDMDPSSFLKSNMDNDKDNSYLSDFSINHEDYGYQSPMVSMLFRTSSEIYED